MSFKVDNKYIDKVTGEMSTLLFEQGFKLSEDNVFTGEKKAFKVEYNDEKQMYILLAADVEEGNVGEFSQVDAWLFDDSQNAKDAEAVGIDFTASARKILGIKIKRNNVGDIDVALPSMNKSGSITVTGFTKKLLDIFPTLKDEYKIHVATNGNFLYLHFLGEKVAPLIKGVMLENNKKQVKKIYDLLADIYVHGDKEAVNAELVLLCAAAYDDATVENNIYEMLAENTHFLHGFGNLLISFKSNKKLKATMLK